MKKLTKYEINAIAKKASERIAEVTIQKLYNKGGSELQNEIDEFDKALKEYTEAERRIQAQRCKLNNLLSNVKSGVEGEFVQTITTDYEGALCANTHGIASVVEHDLIFMNIDQDLRVHELIERLVNKYCG